MNLSSEAGPQRLHGGVAQPQNSTKESLTDITLLLTIDHTARSSRASSKSMSLELLLHLHSNVGAVVAKIRIIVGDVRPPLRVAFDAWATKECHCADICIVSAKWVVGFCRVQKD